MTFPWMSKFIYKSTNYIKLSDKIKKDVDTYTSTQVQTKAEITFNLFEFEMKELIRWAKEKDTK